MIKDLLINKNSKEKSQIKSLEIAKLKHSGIYDSPQYGVKIEIIGDVKAIEINGQHGIELFAKAWRGTQQLGFGSDGSVEIERFRIFNPQILVRNKENKIIKDFVLRTKEDIASIANQVGVLGFNIKRGKIGNTTTTIYPQAGEGGGNVTCDGVQCYNSTAAGESWATVHDSAGNATDDTASSQGITCPKGGTTTNNWSQICRMGFSFDITAIPDTDLISSATFDLYVTGKQDDFSDSYSLVNFTPGNAADFGTSDYGQHGITKQATDLTIASFTNGVYNSWTLNSTGLTTISNALAGNIVKFGVRGLADLNNSAPSWVSGGQSRITHDTADGTNKPRLVVVHSSPNISISISDTLAITENLTKLINQRKQETITISENSTFSTGLKKTETISFSEASLTASTFQRNPTNLLLFAETMSSLSDFKKVFSDNIIFAESLSKHSGKSISDSLSIIESIARISEFQRALSESLTIAEATSITVQFQRMIAETLNIVEALSKAANLSFSSALSMTETLLTTSAYSRSLTENITIVESLLRLAEFKLNFSNVISIAENLTKQTELSFVEALSILESFAKTSTFDLQKIDTFALAEALSKQVGKPISDLVTILDTAPTVARGLLTSESDTISISEQIVKGIGLGVSATVAISENSTRLTEFMRSFSDSVQITETLAKQLVLSLQELTSLAENLTKLITQRKQETISIAENSIFSTGLGKTETISFSESFRKEAVKQNVDSLQISETLSKASSLIVTDSVSIQDILKFENIKKITDLFAIAESTTKAISIPLSSILLITENAAKHTQRPLSANVSISESHAAAQDYVVHIVDSVALLEMLVKEFGLSITDASAIAASISLNYMSAFATQRTTILTSIQGRTVLLAR